jgi:hypothetical protein
MRAPERLGETAGIEIVVVPTLYPTGGEKQLIKILTGKEVPSRGCPSISASSATTWPPPRASTAPSTWASR